ncbi:rhodanese-like domain-containing protein [Dyadobacter sp. MSC1_007]|jgi:thiosulfate/3-mercaptopyruvate sulfurtransferase|uniref:rhodanese-like domain-containing protein n=1 Tax=Dyadobacter sp. MSC1_007 TaxID=2909264 RepID=UPI0020306289|nr:rhodanese-like domain-containing protein [Dyadobacter sp. MSC1_007]
MHLKLTSILVMIIVMTIRFQAMAQSQPVTWTVEQLVSPEALAERINANKAPLPLVISVGPSALIKGSVDAGEAHEKASISQLKSILAKESKNREVIIYCGCCPFAKCPNVRPALALLKDLKFSDAKLLNLEKNVKTDWIDKGYPVNEK